MRTLLKFGSGSKLYTFPTRSQVIFTDNFASLVTKTVRMPGVNGGFSNLGTGRGLSPIGTVRVDNWLTFNDFVEATDKVDSLRQMADWGLQPLFMQPLYGPTRFCFARLSDQQLQQNVHNTPHNRQKVPVVFEVPNPFWCRTVSGFGQLWDDGVGKWDDGGVWDASLGYNISLNTSYSFTNNGNYFTLPTVMLSNDGVSDVSDIRVRRIVDGAIEDEFSYSAALAAGTYLYINPEARRVLLGPTGTNVLANFTANTPDWIRLLPGSNSLNVTCNGSLTLYLQYLERFV